MIQHAKGTSHLKYRSSITPLTTFSASGFVRRIELPTNGVERNEQYGHAPIEAHDGP